MKMARFVLVALVDLASQTFLLVLTSAAVCVHGGQLFFGI